MTPQESDSPYADPRLRMPTKDALASCDDVLLRLQPCIRSILEYLRAQGRHPDTSMIGPHELFRATGCYFTGEEINRLLQAFNSDPMTPEDAAAAGAGQPLGVQASPSVWPLLPSRLLLATLRARGDGRRGDNSSGVRRKRLAPRRPLEKAAEPFFEAVEPGDLRGEALTTHRVEAAELSNQQAVQMLARGDLSGCFRLLDGAQKLLDLEGGVSPLAAITANNLACYYRRQGLLKKALHQLLRASAIEAQCEAPRGAADTQINLCVVLSELNRHSEAVMHAGRAVRLVEMESADAEAAGYQLPPDRVAVHATAASLTMT